MQAVEFSGTSSIVTIEVRRAWPFRTSPWKQACCHCPSAWSPASHVALPDRRKSGNQEASEGQRRGEPRVSLSTRHGDHSCFSGRVATGPLAFLRRDGGFLAACRIKVLIWDVMEDVVQPKARGQHTNAAGQVQLAACFYTDCKWSMFCCFWFLHF